MLLGSGIHLRHRRKVKRQLGKMGFRDILIMEEHTEPATIETEYGGIDEKFEWLIKTYRPSVFFAFFHKDSFMDAVTFEIGWICGKFGTKSIGKKLRFLFEKGYDFEKQRTTAYIHALYSKTPRVFFDESKKYEKSSELIRIALVSN